MEYIIERKDIKRVRLRVFPDSCVKLSVPLGVTDDWIEGYLKTKRPWIIKTLEGFQETRASETETIIKNGVSTRILGRQLRITVKEGPAIRITVNEEGIHIQSPAWESQENIGRHFRRWWHKQCRSYYLEAIDKLYHIIAKHGLAKPSLRVLKMRTLWGSSSKKHNRINLNYYLYKAPPACIDYVVLHELAHFLHPGHTRQFYDFLTVHMPDWQDRKRILDYEVVRGLGLKL